MLFFEWDEAKAKSNRRKHGIDFDEAARIFQDESAISEPERVVDGEQRWQTIGRLGEIKVLLVAHTVIEDDPDEIIRIISARQATLHERKRYEQNYSQKYGRDQKKAH